MLNSNALLTTPVSVISFLNTSMIITHTINAFNLGDEVDARVLEPHDLYLMLRMD